MLVCGHHQCVTWGLLEMGQKEQPCGCNEKPLVICCQQATRARGTDHWGGVWPAVSLPALGWSPASGEV